MSAAPEAVELQRLAYRNPETYIFVAMDLNAALKKPHGPYDLVLLNADHIRIPKQNWVIHVAGEVLFPGAVQYVKDAPVSYYLDCVGGYSPDADRSETLIVYPNGKVRQAYRFWFGSREVTAGSRIIAVSNKGWKYTVDTVAIPTKEVIQEREKQKAREEAGEENQAAEKVGKAIEAHIERATKAEEKAASELNKGATALGKSENAAAEARTAAAEAKAAAAEAKATSLESKAAAEKEKTPAKPEAKKPQTPKLRAPTP